jgi:hypothetical protein
MEFRAGPQASLTPHHPVIRSLAERRTFAGEEDQHQAAGVFATRHCIRLQGWV